MKPLREIIGSLNAVLGIQGDPEDPYDLELEAEEYFLLHPHHPHSVCSYCRRAVKWWFEERANRWRLFNLNGSHHRCFLEISPRLIDEITRRNRQ